MPRTGQVPGFVSCTILCETLFSPEPSFVAFVHAKVSQTILECIVVRSGENLTIIAGKDLPACSVMQIAIDMAQLCVMQLCSLVVECSDDMYLE